MKHSVAWKPANLGVKAPHLVLKIEGGRFDGTYGVFWITLKNGRPAFAPVGSGRGLGYEEAVKGAQRANATMHEPSEALGQQF